MASVIRGNDNFDSFVHGSGWTSSSDLSWVKDTTYTFNHSLGVVPKYYSVEYVAIQAVYGYAIGETIFSSGERYSGWGERIHTPTTTNFKLSMLDAGILIRRKDSQSNASNSTSVYFQVRINLRG